MKLRIFGIGVDLALALVFFDTWSSAVHRVDVDGLLSSWDLRAAGV